MRINSFIQELRVKPLFLWRTGTKDIHFDSFILRFHHVNKDIIGPMLLDLLTILLVAFLFFNHYLFIVLLIPYPILHYKVIKKSADNKQKHRYRNQFKDGMLAVSFSLNVGYSIENSFSEAINELILLYGEDSMIVKDFQNIVRRIRCNERMELILEELGAQTEIEDVQYFAQVFRHAKKSGGDLIAIIKNTATVIDQKVQVDNDIQTMISGKKMEQKIMEYIPFMIVFYLKVSSPEFIAPLYGNAVGVVTMSLCTGVYFIAVYLARRIVEIEV